MTIPAGLPPRPTVNETAPGAGASAEPATSGFAALFSQLSGQTGGLKKALPAATGGPLNAGDIPTLPAAQTKNSRPLLAAANPPLTLAAEAGQAPDTVAPAAATSHRPGARDSQKTDARPGITPETPAVAASPPAPQAESIDRVDAKTQPADADADDDGSATPTALIGAIVSPPLPVATAASPAPTGPAPSVSRGVESTRGLAAAVTASNLPAATAPADSITAGGAEPQALTTKLTALREAPGEGQSPAAAPQNHLPNLAAHPQPAPVNTSVTSSPLAAGQAFSQAALGSPEWQQALSQQLSLFSHRGQQRAELRLHPEDLGQINIHLHLDNDQMQLQLNSPHSQVRAALEAALPHLRTSLAESGIALGQTSVGSEGFNGQQPPQQQSRQPDSGYRTTDSRDEVSNLPLAAANITARGLPGGIDTFA